MKRRGFTLTELLVVITIIGILAGMMMGAMASVREQGREAATKATIAKLNVIIMRRYESYMHRRVPVDLSGCTSPNTVAQDRLYAIRDLMRMEMPDRPNDITQPPIKLPNSGKSVPRPALSQLYLAYYTAHSATMFSGPPNKLCTAAEMLYLTVSLGSPEDMEQFTQSEIGDTDGNGWLEFLDGWGRPIFFLRWAPGFSSYSDIQVADYVNHHDPFDPRRVDDVAYQLFPLIYSNGTLSNPDLNNGATSSSTAFYFTGATGSAGVGDIWHLSGDSFTSMGSSTTGSGVGDITNHHIESR